jgi:Tol biopolymer transport system component
MPTPSAIPALIYPTVTYAPPPTEIPFSIPNGRVLFVRDSLENDFSSNGLVLFNLKTQESTVVVHKNEELSGQIVSLSYPNITWSPDGHWIAFVGTDFSKPIWLYAYEDIYIIKSDGTGLRRLTDSPRYNKRDVAWSPEGKYILVAMGINKSDLYLIDSVNGEIVKRLTSNGNNYVAVWSPDGDKIAYLEDSALLIMNVNDRIRNKSIFRPIIMC